MSHVGILGLQGAVQDHLPHLERLGTTVTIVKDMETLARVDRLIVPGGESTVMAMYLEKFGMREALMTRVAGGMPIWGICAGCILLAETVDEQPGPLRVLPVAVTRNAYGRQSASYMVPLTVDELGWQSFPAVYIRAPRITALGASVQVLARRDEDPVFVRKGSVMATTFHPELTDRDEFHRFFLDIPAAQTEVAS